MNTDNGYGYNREDTIAKYKVEKLCKIINTSVSDPIYKCEVEVLITEPGTPLY